MEHKAQAETMCETQRGIISPSISGKEGRQTKIEVVLSAAEAIHQRDVEEGDSFYFIPWRKHLLDLEGPENLAQEPSSPEEKLSLSSVAPPEDQEGQSVNENVLTTEGNLPTYLSNVGVAAKDTSTPVGKFKHSVEQADPNVQVFKEGFGILKECCDNMCMSMSNLQGTLETLVTILRE